MQKNTLRAQRRAARAAHQRQQRIVVAAIAVLALGILLLLGYVAFTNQRIATSATATTAALSTASVATSAAAVTSSVSTPGQIPGTPSSAQMNTTSSGLQYQDMKVGTGAEAKSGSTISVQYTGWLLNNTKFDSSRDRNQPFSFKVGAGNVIPGWDEGVAGMKVGGIRKLVIPPNLGYGVSGYPPTIPGNATLVFEIELLDVK